MATNLEHIFVTLRGIEALPDSIADENSVNWQELAPELVKQPLQVDLMARTTDSYASNMIRRTVVPAYVYRQIRLRTVPDHAGMDDAVPKQNACGNVGLNCVVAANGEVRSLVLDSATPDLYIAPERISGGFFRVLPDQETELSIEFDPYSSLAIPSAETVRVVAVFTVKSDVSSNSLEPLQP